MGGGGEIAETEHNPIPKLSRRTTWAEKRRCGVNKSHTGTTYVRVQKRNFGKIFLDSRENLELLLPCTLKLDKLPHTPVLFSVADSLGRQEIFCPVQSICGKKNYQT